MRNTPVAGDDGTLAAPPGTTAAPPGTVRRAGRLARSVPLAVPALVSLALGLWGIDRHDSMWRDESVTYQVAHRSLGDLWGLLGHIDAVHGLYYLLMHAVFAVWEGGGLVALRLPSTVATALAVAGVGAIGARLAGRLAGTLAGLVLAVLPVTQQYAQEGRSYALVTAGVTWATYFFVRAAGDLRGAGGVHAAEKPRTGNPPPGADVRPGGGSPDRWWVAYALALGIAAWLHEFAVLAPAAHGLTLWWARATRRMWFGWGIAAGCATAALLPLVVVSAGQAEQQLGWLGRPGPSAWLQFVAVSAAGALLCRLLLRAGSADALVRLSLPLLIAPTGLLMTVSLVKPWYVDRYVLYGMTGLALPAGAVLARAIGRRHRLAPVPRAPAACLTAVVAVAVLLPWSLLVRSPQSRKDDVVAVAHAVERTARQGDAVLFMPSRRREWLLSYPRIHDRLDDLALARPPASSRTLQGTELPASEIRRRILAAHRVIALTDPPGQPLDPFPEEKVKRQLLSEDFEVCERVPLLGAQLLVYARPGHCRPVVPP
ncbi:glycosyltransferase family 39 protein [Streptomyces cellulosae]|uniref:Glycosyltransferase family 39 protein n=1 Tax=Streptomyces cellulosae TaxID=1968 RepID=A0ABW7YAR3_STRCE